MKILIVGTGGVGGFYGGLLAKAGNDVTFLARGEHYKKIKEAGLEIKSVVGNFTIKPARVITAPSEMTTPDLVLFCAKTYHTEELCRSLAPAVSQNTIIMPLQNGIDSDQIIQKYLPQSIAIPGIAYIVSAKTAPGLIEQTAGPRNIIFGSRDGKHQEKLAEIERMMQTANIKAVNTQDIQKELWIKFLWIIAFAGMTSLFRSSIGPIVRDPDTMSIYTRCLEEALSVAKALKINVGENEFKTIIEKSNRYKEIDSGSKSSMLVDIENHRPTEVESLHGKLCQLAKEAGVPVPINEIVYYAVRLTNSNSIK